MKKAASPSRIEALKIATYLGCRGAHKTDDGWMPCADHATLIRISTQAEKKMDSASGKPAPKRKKRGSAGWEKLNERGVLSIDTLPGGGIVSGKEGQGPCWPGYVMAGMKPGKNGQMVPNCVPVKVKAEPTNCPKPTQDISLNLRNRQKAIKQAGYGPLNPNEPNIPYWKKIADKWDVTVPEAKKQRCGNCAAFVKTPRMLECIDEGLGSDTDSWSVVQAGDLGYCEIFDFKCASKRTCFAWVVGGPITVEKTPKSVEGIEEKAERLIGPGDIDAFDSPEAARAKAKQLGCIGIRRYSKRGGGQAWMPCTNESDYRRAMGTSPQGRIDIAKRELASIRRALRRTDKPSTQRMKAANAASTPAPKKDRIIGSSRNAANSAASRSSASEIELSQQVISSLKGQVKRHNDRMEELGKPTWSKASLDQLKAVWRRGAGAFSVSHRPGMTRSQWAFGRTRAFLWMLEKGKPKKLSYMSDRDLLHDDHPFKKQDLGRKELLSAAFFAYGREKKRSDLSGLSYQRIVIKDLSTKELGAPIGGTSTRTSNSSSKKPTAQTKKPNEKPNSSSTASTGNPAVEIVAYDPKAQDADGDGLVQEGTNQERDVNQKKPNEQAKQKKPKATADSAERNSRKLTPQQRTELARVNWNNFSNLINSQIAQLKPGQQTNWNIGKLPNGGLIDERQRYIPPPIGKPTIDLNSRSYIRTADGQVHSARAITFNDNGLEVVIPTVGPNGEDWDPSTEEGMRAALDHYRQSGEHLGKFNDRQSAEAYRNWVGMQEATSRYGRPIINDAKPGAGAGRTENPPTSGERGDAGIGAGEGGQNNQPKPPTQPTPPTAGDRGEGGISNPPKPPTQPTPPTAGGRGEGGISNPPTGSRTINPPSSRERGEYGIDAGSGREAIAPPKPSSSSERGEQGIGRSGPTTRVNPVSAADREEYGIDRGVGPVGNATGADWHGGDYPPEFINMDYPPQSWIQADINFANEGTDGRQTTVGDIGQMQIVKDLPEGKFITFSNVTKLDGLNPYDYPLDQGIIYKYRGVAHIIETNPEQVEYLKTFSSAAVNNTSGRTIGNPLNQGPIAPELARAKDIALVYDQLPESMHTIKSIVYRSATTEAGNMVAGYADSSNPEQFTFNQGKGRDEFGTTVLIHEFAHMLDFNEKFQPPKNAFSNWALPQERANGVTEKWKAATAADIETMKKLGFTDDTDFETLNYLGQPQPSTGAASPYGETNSLEDFAEQFTAYMSDKLKQKYVAVDGTRYRYADLFPARAKFFDEWIEQAKTLPSSDVSVAQQHVGNYPPHPHPHQPEKMRNG